MTRERSVGAGVLIAVALSLSAAAPQAARADSPCAAGARSAGALVQLWRGARCNGASVTADGWRPTFKAFADAATGQVVDVNNDISSVALRPGHCVRFWNRTNYQGDPSTIICTPPSPEASAMSSIAFDDRAASMKVCADDRKAECNADGPASTLGGGGGQTTTPPPTPTPTPTPDPPAARMPADPPNLDDEANDFSFPGADTIALQDGSGRYGTFGATLSGARIFGTTVGEVHVPWSESGSGAVVGSTSVISGDALPDGGGTWTEPGTDIWTPSPFYAVAGVPRYYLFYTAVANRRFNSGSTGRRCIGYATSALPFSGYVTAARPLVCPDKGDRWALDADVTSGSGSEVWMTWRDGQRAVGHESALSAMRLRLGTDGSVARASAPRVILTSDHLTWAHYKKGDGGDRGVAVIENPTAFYNAGSWYLFFSGNRWQENYYSTGIASCGSRLDDDLCRPMPNRRRAWFAYVAPTDALPASRRKYALPGNKRGPGAMDVYRAHDGRPWVTWNYLSDRGGRKSRTAPLSVTGTGSAADFRVG
jgi:hypothetical protein